MAILPIKIMGTPILREPAQEVGEPTHGHRKLISDLFDTMRDAPGLGLAAPQVGVGLRIFVWEVEEAHGAVVDPVIVERSDVTVDGEEGCLSIPGLLYEVPRSDRIVVEGKDENGRPLRIDASDFLARVFQHEIDHLDGVLFIDRLSPDLREEAITRWRDLLLSPEGVTPYSGRTSEVAPEAPI
ncbi:MAG: peptide deformylase [Actinobacteria bacterium]|nr:peptide deformylase [Actinomycetota bacterium]